MRGNKQPDIHADSLTQRMVFAYRAASLAALAISLFWAAVFAWQGWRLLTFFEIALAAVALASWFLIGAGRLTIALIISEIAFLIFVIAFCTLFDVPTENAARVSHLFLPVLAMLGYINYLRRRSAFQLAIIAICLVAFVIFSSTRLALPFAQPIPDDIRFVGTWVNSILATLMMCGAIYALQLESTRMKGLARELRAALQARELELFLQPQVNIDRKLIGVEALLRWKHPRRGYVAPAIFIPAAEESGLMPALGQWVLQEACRTLNAWKEDPALSSLVLAVNVSASQFAVEDFEQSVLDMIAIYTIDPGRLKLELTESVVISGMERVVGKMETLRTRGIRFALDDFGTGYSSLSYLRRLPIDEIKIDRSFVQEAPESDDAASLVKSIVQIGLDLGHVMLAEGVETQEQYAFLRNCGCTEFQGYYFGRPLSRQAFEQSVRSAGRPAGMPA